MGIVPNAIRTLYTYIQYSLDLLLKQSWYLVVVSRDHDHRLGPFFQAFQNSVQQLHTERAPHMPEVAQKYYTRLCIQTLWLHGMEILISYLHAKQKNIPIHTYIYTYILTYMNTYMNTWYTHNGSSLTFRFTDSSWTCFKTISQVSMEELFTWRSEKIIHFLQAAWAFGGVMIFTTEEEENRSALSSLTATGAFIREAIRRWIGIKNCKNCN